MLLEDPKEDILGSYHDKLNHLIINIERIKTLLASINVLVIIITILEIIKYV